MEKAIYTWGLIAPETTWPFIPARESEACWLFHVSRTNASALNNR
jgi:hypothetical protein